MRQNEKALCCRRCGKKTKDPQWIPIAGTTYVVSTCPDCYTYLTESDVAYDRFVIIERESKKKKLRRTLKW